jgi:hypothetical protein
MTMTTVGRIAHETSMTATFRLLRRIAQSASVLAMLIGLVRVGLAYRATGEIGWVHLIQALSCPVAIFGAMAWADDQQHIRKTSPPVA